jgi:hypothetical protein
MDPFEASRFLISKGFSPLAASALVGRLQVESPGLNPLTVHDNNTGFGLAGWRGPRLKALQSFSPNYKDAKTQLDFLAHELSTTEKGPGDKLRSATTLPDAVNAVMDFERPFGWRPGSPTTGLGYGRTMKNASALNQPSRLAPPEEEPLPTMPPQMTPFGIPNGDTINPTIAQDFSVNGLFTPEEVPEPQNTDTDMPDTDPVNAAIMQMIQQSQGGSGGLLGRIFPGMKGGVLDFDDDTRAFLMNLGAGIAAGSQDGWGPGVGKGLALASAASDRAADRRSSKLNSALALYKLQSDLNYRNEQSARDDKRTKLYEDRINRPVLGEVGGEGGVKQKAMIRPDGTYTPVGKPIDPSMNLTAVDKEEINTSVKSIQAGNAALVSLKALKELNDNSFAGWGAETRGWLGANFGREASDWGKAGSNTLLIKNKASTLALDQLKAVFGGMPTEGERKILIEVQGSANQPAAVRKRIWDDAEKAVRLRIEQNKEKAKALSTGTWYRNPLGDGTTPEATTELPPPPDGYEILEY